METSVKPNRSKQQQPTHTPGPWHVQDNTDQPRGQLRVDSACDGAVAICGTNDPDHRSSVTGKGFIVGDDLRANARLIAAAPELLAALKDLMWRFNDAEPPCNDADVIQARAAIAKAEGH